MSYIKGCDREQGMPPCPYEKPECRAYDCGFTGKYECPKPVIPREDVHISDPFPDE